MLSHIGWGVCCVVVVLVLPFYFRLVTSAWLWLENGSSTGETTMTTPESDTEPTLCPDCRYWPPCAENGKEEDGLCAYCRMERRAEDVRHVIDER